NLTARLNRRMLWASLHATRRRFVMRGRSNAALAFVILTLIFGGVTPARGAIPGAADPKAPTRRDFLKGELEFEHRMLREEYETLGKHDPKWDDAAVKLLDRMADRFTYGSEDPLYLTAPPPTWDELLALAQVAAEAGCDDPLVTYCH